VIEYLSGAVADFNPVLRAVPDPVYVCAKGGLSATVVNWDRRRPNDYVGTPLIFPVMADPAVFRRS